MMQLEIVRQETIKPLFSTPPELRLLQLCLFDRQAPYLYLQLLYFYENGSNLELLKHSLSQALTFYYPFAGRLRDDGCSIDCNDMGVTFLEAKLGCPISEIMSAYNLQRDEIVKLLCFDDMNGKDQRFNPLLSVQVTRFECGGEAICVFLSHKLADASTFTNFMNHWASISSSSSYGRDMPPMEPPQFNAASLFEAATTTDLLGEGLEVVKRDKNIVTKRFMFEGSKIAALKAMVSDKVENPTRVQVLVAFLYKVAISSWRSMAASDSKTRPTNFLVKIAINLRTRVIPPMPATLSGNIISFFLASPTTTEMKEMELWRLSRDMKRSMEEFCNKYPKRYKEEEWSWLHKLHMKESMERMTKSNNNNPTVVYACSSWCRFPFYEADFGWGKPVWITAPVLCNKNVIILMDAKDGDGIEALVSLEKEEMAFFERNEELLSFSQFKSF